MSIFFLHINADFCFKNFLEYLNPSKKKKQQQQHIIIELSSHIPFLLKIHNFFA